MENKNYRIIITRVEPNTEFAKMTADAERMGGAAFLRDSDIDTYRGKVSRIPKEIETGVLITEITEEQFKKLQPEIVKIFE